MGGSGTSPYSENNRLYLVVDALVGLINYYPNQTVSIYPLINTIKLLVQKPLIFSFLNEQLCRIYCSMNDPQYSGDMDDLLNQVTNHHEMIRFKPPCGNHIYNLVIYLQSYKDETNNLQFTPAPTEILELYKKLFFEIESDFKLSEALHIALLEHIEQNPRVEKFPQPPHLSNDEYYKLIKPIRIALDEALGELANSPLLHYSPDEPDKDGLPFPNIFFVVQRAIGSKYSRKMEVINSLGELIQIEFDYTAQIMLSNTQIESIINWCKQITRTSFEATSLNCCPFRHSNCLIKSTANTFIQQLKQPIEEHQLELVAKQIANQLIMQLEQPTDKEARTISDTVFSSGTLEYSPESASKGRDVGKGIKEEVRRKAEECIYAQIVNGPPNALLIPIPIGGVPWVTLFSLTSPQCASSEISWKHNYHICRTITRSIETRLKIGVQRLYLELIAAELEHESIYSEGHLNVTLLNKLWNDIAAVYPFDIIEILYSRDINDTTNLSLKSSHSDIHYFLKLHLNQYYHRRVSQDRISLTDVYAFCQASMNRCDKELSEANNLFKQKVLKQAHTIKNLLAPLYSDLNSLVQYFSSINSDQCFTRIVDSYHVVEILMPTWQIALSPNGSDCPDTLSKIKSIEELIMWFADKTVSSKPKIKFLNNNNGKPVQIGSIVDSFTILWNLLDNASKASGNSKKPIEVTISIVNEQTILSISNVGKMSKEDQQALMVDNSDNNKPLKGLQIISRTVREAGWFIDKISVKNSRTTIYIRIPGGVANEHINN